MKNLLYTSAFAALACLSFSSCSDFLDAENKSAGGLTADDYFSTSTGLAGYRNYAYSLLKSLVGTNYLDMNDDASDIYWQSRGKKSVYDIYTFTTETSDFRSLYVAAYKMINAANGVMSYGSAYDSDMKFLRAYGYYILTQQFGSVPYVTSYINDATTGYARTDLKAIYDGCLKDLDDVIADASIAESSTDGYVNRKAAQALAAKIALAAGWDLQTTLTNDKEGTYTINGTDYFAKAASYADGALSGMSLLDSFADKWSPSNEGNQEVIYAIPYDRAAFTTVGSEEDGGHSMQNQYGGYYGNQSTQGVKNTSSCEIKSLKSLYLWEESDERYNGTFQQVIYNYDGTWGTTGYFAYLNAADKLDNINIAFYYANAYTSEADFDAFVSEAAASGRFAYYKADVNEASPWQVQGTAAYLLGATVKVVSFNPDGSVNTTENVDYETLQQRVNAIDCVKKWDDPNTLMTATSNGSYRDLVLLHESETILTAAEAYLMAGNEAKALELVNQLRTRAKASSLASFADYKPDYIDVCGYDFTFTPLDVVLDERARELFGEPGRWVDLRRTKQQVRYYLTYAAPSLGISYDNMTNGKGEVKWLRPIPADELSDNDQISAADQNPGY